MKQIPIGSCQCGCGAETSMRAGKRCRYLRGHHRRGTSKLAEFTKHMHPCSEHPKSKANAKGECRECCRIYARLHYHNVKTGSTRWFKRRFFTARNTARTRDLAWTLTFDEYLNIVSQSCIYAVQQPDDIRVGIDRKDNAVGYIAANCVPCCSRHNVIKGAFFTHEQMMEASRRCNIACGNRTA